MMNDLYYRYKKTFGVFWVMWYFIIAIGYFDSLPDELIFKLIFLVCFIPVLSCMLAVFPTTLIMAFNFLFSGKRTSTPKV